MGFEVAARTERCAVEGELLVELTKHGVMVSNSERTVNGQFVPWAVRACLEPLLATDFRCFLGCGANNAEDGVRGVTARLRSVRTTARLAAFSDSMREGSASGHPPAWRTPVPSPDASAFGFVT